MGAYRCKKRRLLVALYGQQNMTTGTNICSGENLSASMTWWEMTAGERFCIASVDTPSDGRDLRKLHMFSVGFLGAGT